MQNEEICRCLNKSFLAVSYIVDKVGGCVCLCGEIPVSIHVWGSGVEVTAVFSSLFFFFFFLESQ